MPRKRAASNVNKAKKTPTRRSARRAATDNNALPEVYRDLLVEAYENNPDDFQPDTRPTKRIKVAEPTANEDVLPQTPGSTSHVLANSRSQSPLVTSQLQQTVFNDEFDDSDETDEFEDVEIDRRASVESADELSEPKPVQIDLTASKSTLHKLMTRRKPATKAERDFRLDVHKWHLSCLMVHVAIRNKWCDDPLVQSTLKPLISRKLISRLHREGTQAEQKFAFERAIEEICTVWRETWTTNSRGMRRAYWRDNLDMAKEIDNSDDPVDLEDFRVASEDRVGSRDVGAQLFCALLRSLAVDTRIVCSLQVLPFSRVAKGETPQKTTPTYIQAGTQDYGTSRQAGRNKKSIEDSSYPIWWVEVFHPATDQWMPLDPVVRNTVNKPRTGFEPPASDQFNSMSYVMAFDEDETAKDVTRRYTASYNAKTRKIRVENTKYGRQWYEKVMNFYNRAILEARDEIENAALDRRVAQEGMPKNVQDFKDHPIYVLERHLRSNEVIEPRRECGKFSVGTGKNQKVEAVYRRENVHACRSADGWYRRGRDVTAGSQPLKHAKPRREVDDEDDEGVALYAEFQTDLYIPPPVVDGKVPRNGYGNLDIYVRSMIPGGGVHIRHPLAAEAARTLKIDAAEAVTGFKFKGRQGTAIIDGVVVDERYLAAISAATKALEDELDEQIQQQKRAILLSVWKKMHAVLKVRQRIEEDYGHVAREQEISDGDGDDDDSTYEDDAGGGFMKDSVGEATKESKAEEAANLSLLKDRQPIYLPPDVIRQEIKVVRSLHTIAAQKADESDDELFGYTPQDAGGFLLEDGNAMDIDNKDGRVEDVKKPVTNVSVDFAGGWLPEDNDDGAGGFERTADEGGGFQEENSALPDSKPNEIPFRSEAQGETASIGPSAPSQRNGHVNQSAHQPAEALQSTSQQTNGQSLPSTQASKSSSTARRKRKGKMVADDAESDADSMLSHDPEEDDLEPQWLEDAFDDEI